MPPDRTSPPPPPPPRSERGFALLVTITLVAFLVLLLVSLATLTRVETQIASNQQDLSGARQNALAALNIAIAQLQKFTGPDQRTTARADLPYPSGQPHGHWIGAYGSSIATDYAATAGALTADLTDPALVNPIGSRSRLLSWLVSGNESTAFDPRWTSGDVGANGEIIASPDPASVDALPFNPSAAVTGLTATTTATNVDLLITDAAGTAHPARLLVGGNSVTSSVVAGVPVDYVVAPAVDITVAPAIVPGAGTASGDITIGRYAWWVGDEGAKARINLPLAGTDPARSFAEQLAEKRHAFSSAPRAAIELMTRGATANPPLDAETIGLSRYVPAEAADVLSLPQLPLASNDESGMRAATKARFHDLTPYSFTVLADTAAGGLREDLTRALDRDSISPAGNATLWTPEVAGENTTFIPTWGHLRSYASALASPGTLVPQLPAYGPGVVGRVGISPVVTYAALGFRYSTAEDPASQPATAVRFNLFPVFVLWNPYTAPLAASTYEVGLGYLGAEARVRLEVNTAAPGDAEVWEVRERRDLRYAGRTVGASEASGQPVEYFRFAVDCPVLAPGESVIFTLGAPSAAYTPGANTLRAGLNPHHHAWLSDLNLTPAEADQDFRFTPQSGSLRPNGNAEVALYLGDGTAPPITDTGSWDPALNRWYQFVQRVDYAGIADTYTHFADAETLRPLSPVDEPALKWFVMNVFSSVGKSYVINNNFGASIPRYRWIAQGNVRAPALFRTRRDPNFVVPYYAKFGVSSNMWPVWFLQNPTDFDRASSGLGLDYDIGNNPAPNRRIDATLFEIRPADQPLSSIAQLQHANLSLAGSYPSYPIGNAIADFRLPAPRQIQTSAGRPLGGGDLAVRHPRYYDISWLLNHQLWDRYYFSTVPGTGPIPATLPAARLVRLDSPADAELRDRQLAAAHLLLAGGFNVNSTSEQAWRAVLGGLNQLTYDPVNATHGPALGPTFSRFSAPTAGTDLPANVIVDASYNAADGAFTYVRGDRMDTLWQGYRALSDAQIAQLARNLVAEIRARGPFVSLADFVNRRLVEIASLTNSGAPYGANASLTAAQRTRFTAALKGALQAAIDATSNTTATSFPANDVTGGSFWNNTRTLSSLPPGDLTYYSLPLARGDPNPGTSNSEKTAQRATAAFAPKYLTQADILSTIGSSLAARSDTFTVRAYGEKLNPVTQSITGQAWCEAVVQRLPAYVDAATNDPADPVSDLSAPNQAFGRQYKIVSFRWLSPDDI